MKHSCFLLCCIFLFGSIIFSQSVKEHGQLKVEGGQLKDAKGNPFVLRGMSFGWHNWWPRFYTAGTVQWLVKDWKCSVLRAAMGIEPRGSYMQKPDWSKQTVETVVDEAIRQDVYVIIDWHSHGVQLEAAKKFFTEMATTYGKKPHIIYEIFNEPDQESWGEVKAYSIEVISAIRAIDADNIILIGSPHWDQDINVVADDPIKGFSNIMYTLHYYAASHGEDLRQKADYALRKGIPLFISESAGMNASGDGALNMPEWNKWINWAEKKKISWVTWAISDKEESCSVLLPSASSEGSWKDTDLKDSGKKIRDLLRKYNGVE